MKFPLRRSELNDSRMNKSQFLLLTNFYSRTCDSTSNLTGNFPRFKGHCIVSVRALSVHAALFLKIVPTEPGHVKTELTLPAIRRQTEFTLSTAGRPLLFPGIALLASKILRPRLVKQHYNKHVNRQVRTYCHKLDSAGNAGSLGE